MPKKTIAEEKRHVVIYGYTREELRNIMRHFEAQLPDFVKISISSSHLVTKITLTGVNEGVELLRFKINKFHQTLQDMFSEEIVTTEDKSVSRVLGDLLTERELTIACAESCTGGNIAQRILAVSRNDLGRYGAVSREVVAQMASGASTLMQSDCALATSGIAGPDGGSKFKPVGTVWMAAKYGDQTVTELIHFDGNRNSVIESATNHVMVMLIKLLRNNYTEQEEINDD